MPERAGPAVPLADDRRAVVSELTRHAALAVAVAAGYLLGSQAAFWWFGADGVTASFFPAAGVALAALLLTSPRRWPTVVLAVVVAEVGLDLAHDIALDAALGYAVANAGQALVGAVLVRRWVGRPDLGRLRDLGAFLLGAVLLAPVVGGVLGATTNELLADGDRWLRFGVEWWVGDGLGVLVVGAALLTCAAGQSAPVRPGPRPEGLALAAGAVAATAVLFWLRWPPAAFAVVALVLFLAFRHGTRAVAVTGLVAAVVAAQATSRGQAYWAALDISPATGVVYVQAVMAAIVGIGLALAAQVGERERAVVARAEAEVARREFERSHRRSERMRALAEALSTAVTVGEVGQAFLHAALPKVEAVSGALMVLDDDGTHLTTAALLGRRTERWRSSVPCTDGWFLPAAVLTGRTVVARTREEVERQFPATAANLGPATQSVVALPLRAFGTVIGAFGLELSRELRADEVDVSMLETMATVCGPALERARSFEAEALAHRALRASEARFRDTFENAPVGIAEADVDGRYLRVNPRLCEITGYGEDELLALTYQEITHPDDVAVDVGLSRQVIRGEIDTYTLEKRFVRRDGAVVWVDLEVSVARDEQGGVSHLIAVIEDIGDRKEAETALRQSEARFRALFSSIDEGYCLAELIVDADGRPADYRFLEVNPLFEEMTGLADAEGRTALELVPDLEPEWAEIYGRVALGGEPLRFEQGSEALGRWFDVFATPVEPRGRFALVFKDISLRKAAEQALQESREAERRSRRRAELLAEVMGSLEELEGFEARARRLVQLLVPRLADAAVLELLDEEPVAVAAARARRRAPETAAHASLVVPISAGDVACRLRLELLDPARPVYSSEEEAFVREVANRAGTLLASARLREAEHLVAISLQRALLPDDVLRHPAVAVGAHYEAGADVLEVGGDWYDSFELPDGSIGLVVGDVVGHGLEAAATMGRYRTALAALARHTTSPAELLTRMEAFANGPDGCDFATCCYAILDPGTGLLRYASAGHPPLLLMTPDGGVRWLDDARSLPLCGLSPGGREDAAVVLEPGTLLVLYSDGLVERRREPLTAGLGRLEAAARDLRDEPVDRLCRELVRRLRAHSAGEDDAVAVAVRYTPTTSRAFRHVMPARGAELSCARAALRRWFELADVPEPVRRDVLILAGEAVANAVEHAYGDGATPGVVEIEARLEDDGAIVLDVRDHGVWRAPTPRDDRGRGTGIMHALAQSLERRSDGHGTAVRVRVPTAGGVPVEA